MNFCSPIFHNLINPSSYPIINFFSYKQHRVAFCFDVSIVIISKDDYKAWQENKKVLNLYSGETEPLSEEDKKIIRNEDGSIDYNGEHFEDEYDFMESDYYENSNVYKYLIDKVSDLS